jgi:hypothetical protein
MSIAEEGTIREVGGAWFSRSELMIAANARDPLGWAAEIPGNSDVVERSTVLPG